MYLLELGPSFNIAEFKDMKYPLSPTAKDTKNSYKILCQYLSIQTQGMFLNSNTWVIIVK